MQMHKLDDRVHNAEVQIDIYEGKIKVMEKKVAEMRGRTFSQRILRQ